MAKINYEIKVAREAKSNPKGFFNMYRTKRRTHPGMSTELWKAKEDVEKGGGGRYEDAEHHGETYSDFLVEFTLTETPKDKTCKDILNIDWDEYDFIF